MVYEAGVQSFNATSEFDAGLFSQSTIEFLPYPLSDIFTGINSADHGYFLSIFTPRSSTLS